MNRPSAVSPEQMLSNEAPGPEARRTVRGYSPGAGRELDKLLLVIPAYHESGRLPPFLRGLMADLRAAPWQTTVQIVDDGSGEAERERLAEAVRAVPSAGGQVSLAPIAFLSAHAGKGAAIRRGWESVTDESVVGFVDADGSVPSSEVVRAMESYISRSQRSALIATRGRAGDRILIRNPGREIMGRVFAFVASRWLGFKCRDSQCGLKLLPVGYYRALQPSLVEEGFAIDLELLVQLTRANFAFVEFPVDWIEQRHSRVRLLRDSWRLLCAVERLRRRRPRSDAVAAFAARPGGS